LQQKLDVLEQQTSLLIAMELLSLRLANFSSTVMWLFILAVLDHSVLYHLERTCHREVSAQRDNRDAR